MRLRLIVSEEHMSPLLEKLNGWDANIVSRDESGNQLVSLAIASVIFYFQFSNCLIASGSNILSASSYLMFT